MVLLDSNTSLRKEKKDIKTLIEQRVRGVIIAPVNKEKKDSFNYLKKLEDSKIPYIFVDREVEGKLITSVHTENSHSSYEATKFLLKKTKNVAMISGPIRTTTATKRLKGYKKAMEEKGVEKIVYYGDYKINSGYEIINNLIKEKMLPKALFIANNMMTLGVIKGLIENNIKISKDIELFSYNKVDMAEIFGIKIDYLDFDIKSVGEKAVELLMEKLKGNKSHRVIKIDGKIVVAK
jgi:LacI family transcriptional regulator